MIAGMASDVLAALLVVAAVCGLFIAWRRRNRTLAILSAVPVVGAVAAAAARHGIEYAFVYVCMALTMGAWLVVFLNRDFIPPRRDVKPDRRLQPPSLSALGRGWEAACWPARWRRLQGCCRRLPQWPGFPAMRPIGWCRASFCSSAVGRR